MSLPFTLALIMAKLAFDLRCPADLTSSKVASFIKRALPIEAESMISVSVTVAPFMASWPLICAPRRFTSAKGGIVHQESTADGGGDHV